MHENEWICTHLVCVGTVPFNLHHVFVDFILGPNHVSRFRTCRTRCKRIYLKLARKVVRFCTFSWTNRYKISKFDFTHELQIFSAVQWAGWLRSCKSCVTGWEGGATKFVGCLGKYRVKTSKLSLFIDFKDKNNNRKEANTVPHNAVILVSRTVTQRLHFLLFSRKLSVFHEEGSYGLFLINLHYMLFGEQCSGSDLLVLTL